MSCGGRRASISNIGRQASRAHDRGSSNAPSHEVSVPPLGLAGTLTVPADSRSLVVFAHGSGSSRFSPRNRAVADALNERAIATLLFDLLNEEEEADRANVFDIALLAERLAQAVGWVEREPRLRRLPLGFFGASTGAAAALVAAARNSAPASAPSCRAAAGRISPAQRSTG